MSDSDTGVCVFIKKHWGIVVIVAAFINYIFFSGLIYGYNLLHVELQETFNATATESGFLLAPCLNWMYVTFSWQVSLRILCVLYAIIGYLSALVMVEMNPTVVEEPNEEKKKITLPIQIKSFVARCIDVFKRRDFLVATPGFMLAATAMSFTFIGVGSFLVDAGTSNASISLILALMGVADLCGRIGAALFSDVVPISRTVQYAVMNFIAAIPTVCLPFIMSSNGRMAALIVIGVPRALLAVLLPTVAMELSREERRAEAIGIIYMMFGLGTFATPYVTDTIYDITGSYDIAWFICAGLYALAGICMSIAAWDTSNHMELNRMRYDQVEKDDREVEL